MGSHVVSFRFSDQEIELLRQHADSEDESTNAIAQRLLRELLGVSTITSTNVDVLESRVQAIVDARMSAIASENETLRQQKEQLADEVQSMQAEVDKIEQPPTALPDLYDIRDRVLNNWKLAKRAESKQRLREFADKLIKDAITDDTGYTMMQRLLEELEQARKFKRAGD